MNFFYTLAKGHLDMTQKKLINIIVPSNLVFSLLHRLPVTLIYKLSSVVTITWDSRLFASR